MTLAYSTLYDPIFAMIVPMTYRSPVGLILCCIILVCVVILRAIPVYGQEIRRPLAVAVKERRLARLIRQRIELQALEKDFSKDLILEITKSIEGHFAPMRSKIAFMLSSLDETIIEDRDELCTVFSKAEYCPPPPVVEEKINYKISFPVKVTFYNATKAQTDDNPTHGAWGHDIIHFLGEGSNPVAASRDIATNPLGKESKITLDPIGDRPECAFLKGTTFTVMDKLGECTEKNKDKRTGRCLPDTAITNQIDVLLPCVDDACLIGRAKANSIGSCLA